MPENSFSEDEILALRAETPGCGHVTHFNNAGASLMPEPVYHQVVEYLKHELLYGGYETAETYALKLDQVYPEIAGYLGCDPSEIAIMENATAAWGQAFLSIPFYQGDTILTSVSEYASNYIGFLQMKKRLGVKVEVIPNDEQGQIDVTALAAMMHDRVKLIAISHVPTNGGLVNPAEAVGRIAREHDTWYLLDACQSVGQMPINVKQLGCDFLSATSRKYLRGPRGIGFLYVSSSRLQQLEPAVMDLHGASWEKADSYRARNDARRFENWENNLAVVLGLSTAVEYMVQVGVERIWNRIQHLSRYLRNALNDLSGVIVQDQGAVQCGIVSFTSPVDAADIKKGLLKKGFNVSLITPNHTLIDMQNRGLGYMVRASVHYYNTEEEIVAFVNCLKGLLSKSS